PYLAAVLLAAVVAQALSHLPIADATDWTDSHWRYAPNLTDAFDVATLSDSILNGANVNSAVWSLVHEMRISLIMPAIALFVFRTTWRTALAAIIGLWAVALIATHAGGSAAGIVQSAPYVPMFVLGSLLAHFRQELGRLVMWIRLPGRLTAMVVGLA